MINFAKSFKIRTPRSIGICCNCNRLTRLGLCDTPSEIVGLCSDECARQAIESARAEERRWAEEYPEEYAAEGEHEIEW